MEERPPFNLNLRRTPGWKPVEQLSVRRPTSAGDKKRHGVERLFEQTTELTRARQAEAEARREALKSKEAAKAAETNPWVTPYKVDIQQRARSASMPTRPRSSSGSSETLHGQTTLSLLRQEYAKATKKHIERREADENEHRWNKETRVKQPGPVLNSSAGMLSTDKLPEAVLKKLFPHLEIPDVTVENLEGGGDDEEDGACEPRKKPKEEDEGEDEDEEEEEESKATKEEEDDEEEADDKDGKEDDEDDEDEEEAGDEDDKVTKEDDEEERDGAEEAKDEGKKVEDKTKDDDEGGEEEEETQEEEKEEETKEEEGEHEEDGLEQEEELAEEESKDDEKPLEDLGDDDDEE